MRVMALCLRIFPMMRYPYISDLVEQGYFWPETALLRHLAWWYDLDEADLFRDLLLSRN